jgi:hypothetical protein
MDSELHIKLWRWEHTWRGQRADDIMLALYAAGLALLFVATVALAYGLARLVN